MICKLGVLNGKCKYGKLMCKYYKGDFAKETCRLYEILNEQYMASREISLFNCFLSGVLKKN